MPSPATTPRPGCRGNGLQRVPVPWGDREPVVLHVYDVGRLDSLGPNKVIALNRILRPLGTGAFHCGVEVYGQEYSFKWQVAGTGVNACTPRCCAAHSFNESVTLGSTAMTQAEVLQLIRDLEKEWRGPQYNTLKRNCCHFCDKLCIALGVGPLPPFLLHLAATAAPISDAVELLGERTQHLRASLGALLCCSCPAAGRPEVELLASPADPGPGVAAGARNLWILPVDSGPDRVSV